MLSVLMSAYNSVAYLHEAISSTLKQTFGDFEFLIADDGSTDDTQQIIRQYEKQDDRVRLIAHDNWGAADSLNDMAAQAKGDWLVRMDPDDVMVFNRLERQRAFLNEHPELDVISSLVYFIDSQGRNLGRSRSPYVSPEAIVQTIAGPNLICFHHPATAIRKSVFQSVGGYRKQFWPAEDLDLWNRVAEKTSAMLVQPEYLLEYRLHSSSISMTSGRWQVLTVDWVEDSKNRRRAGLPERSYQEFLVDRQQQPWTTRLNDHRRTVARTLYKNALQHWCTRDYLRCVPQMATAMALEPHLFLSRLLPRLAG